MPTPRVARTALLLLLSLASCSLAASRDGWGVSQRWEAFKSAYGRSYATPAEEQLRLAVFARNLERARALNSASDDPSGAQFGVTPFSDLEPREFALAFLHSNASRPKLPAFLLHGRPIHPVNVLAAADSGKVGVDWLAAGIVTPVKNQGQMSESWAFADAGALEACYALHNKYQTVDISAQQIAECCKVEWKSTDTCLQWATKSDIAAASDYAGGCSAEDPAIPAGTCKFYSVQKNEKAMLQALSHSTVAVLVDASSLQFYTGGVVAGEQCKRSNLNHAVLLVSDQGDANSYVVKNSWGTAWGEKGYFRVRRDVNCLGIANDCCLAY